MEIDVYRIDAPEDAFIKVEFVSVENQNEKGTYITITGHTPGIYELLVTIKDSNYDILATSPRCRITVTKKVTSVNLSEQNINLSIGESKKINAIIQPEDASNKTVDWSSSDSSIADVSNDGNVIGKVSGETTITAKTVDGGFISTCKVKVVREIESITLSTKNLKIKKDQLSKVK